MKSFGDFALFVSNELMNNELTQSSVNILMKSPFGFFPHRNLYVNYLDGIHL